MSVQIIHGDCVEVVPDLNCEVDLIVTSPPYDDLRQYDGHASVFDFHATAPVLADVLRDGGVLCWNVQDQQIDGDFTLTSFRQALAFQELGLKCREKLTYERALPAVRGHRFYMRSTEHVFVFTKGTDITFNPIEDRPNATAGGKRKGAAAGRVKDRPWGEMPYSDRVYTVAPRGRRAEVWRYTTGYAKTAPDMPQAHDMHPALMPLKLAKDLIRSYSNEGDLVLDPMCGSGTTAVAAKYLLRNCVGIDINEEYCESARVRTNQDLLV